jgi:hypothetical protein
VYAHIQGNRRLVSERLASVLAAVSREPLSAFEVVPHVYGEALAQHNAQRLLSEVLGYLTHLHATGQVERLAGEPERWTA